MTLGAVDTPIASNPAPGAISILERPWLKVEPVMAANFSFFWTKVPLEAAMVAKLALSLVRGELTEALSREFRTTRCREGLIGD